MLINKDHENSHKIRIAFGDPQSSKSFNGTVASIVFGKAQYQWHPNRKRGYADPDRPPVKTTMQVDETTMYELPAASLTVLRGNLKAVTH
jgi:hypothetical protein